MIARRPRAVFFDRGLVLVYPDKDRLSNTLRAALGVAVAPQRCLDAYSRVIHARDQEREPDFTDGWFWARWCSEVGLPGSMTRSVMGQVEALERSPDRFWTHIEASAPAVLSSLRRRSLVLGIVSNTDGRLQEDMNGTELGALFSILIDSEVVGLRKPDPRIFRLAAERAELEPADCWFVGDDAHIDVRGALTAGFGAAVQYDRLGIYATSEGYHIRELRELLDLVDAARL